MYYEDLSNYRIGERVYSDAVSIGWLDSDHPFRTGPVSSTFIAKLRWIVTTRNEVFDAHCNEMRAIQPCLLCNRQIDLQLSDGTHYVMGMSEIWIPKNDRCDRWFACPSLILHYIEDHQYCPPAEFIDAVIQFDISKAFNASESR